METSEDKQWARASLLSSEDNDVQDTRSETSTLRAHNPPALTGIDQPALQQDGLAPRNSTSTHASRHSVQRKAVPGNSNNGSVRLSSEIPTSTAPPSTYNSDVSRRRGHSLSSRFAGDYSHQPLEIIRKDSQKAHRAPHLRKHQHHGADVIDKLAGMDIAYHHEGPFDAASLARNRRYKDSPLQAVEGTNREALKAVPREKVVDSISRHRPLDGFSFVPPGIPDPHGRVMHYKEGTDMQRAQGADYRRWPGIDYHPDDLKGKGEPSYSIEKALNQHKNYGGQSHRRVFSESGAERNSGIGRSRSVHVAGSGNEPRYSEWEAELRRNDNLSHSIFAKRLGSLRRRRPVGQQENTSAET